MIHDIRKIVERNGKKGIALVTLGQEIRKVHPNFNVKVYGYSQLYRFVGSIPGLVLKGEKANRKVVAKDVS